MKCPKCGNEIANDSVYCEFCGVKVSSCQGNSIKGSSIDHNKSLRYLLYLSLAVIVCVCVYFAYPKTKYSPFNSGEENGYEWVDLGLSVKWARCNVGASSPSDYGNYYAWGETYAKSDYSFSTLKYCSKSSNRNFPYSFSKYILSKESPYWNGEGSPDNKTKLDLSDDAARENWGGKWRTPTEAEWRELRRKCTWTWITQDGKEGYQVTSKVNGGNIFLPAAGYRKGTDFEDVGTAGSYWSSSISKRRLLMACCVDFNSSFSYEHTRSGDRYFGLSIRPVLE